MFQGRDQLNFPFKACPRHQIVHHLAWQNLDCYLAVGNRIKSAINGRHTAAAQLRFNLVSADFIWRHVSSISNYPFPDEGQTVQKPVKSREDHELSLPRYKAGCNYSGDMIFMAQPPR